MSIWQRVRRALAPRAEGLTSHELLRLLTQGSMTSSGATVSRQSTMSIAAAYACVRVLSEAVAQVPLVLSRKDGAKRIHATDHPLFELLYYKPNPFQTSFEFWEMQQAYAALGGNAYALKNVVRNEVRELLPISPDAVTVNRFANWRVTYTVTLPDGTSVEVPADRMLHLRGLSLDGFIGVSPIAFHRETLGLTIQLTKHGASLFRNGAQIGGVLEHPESLSDEAAKRLKESFDERYSGVDNAHKTILLEEGLKFSAIGMTSVDAQFLDSRKYQRSEIASIFRVPPHMIGDLDRATFSNIEHQSLEFVKYTLAPWLRRWEQRIWMQLLSPDEQRNYFARFNVEGLLRGDYKTRTEGYRTAVVTGWMSRNEVRSLEDMNPAEGLDEFFSPLNMDDAGRKAALAKEQTS